MALSVIMLLAVVPMVIGEVDINARYGRGQEMNASQAQFIDKVNRYVARFLESGTPFQIEDMVIDTRHKVAALMGLKMINGGVPGGEKNPDLMKYRVMKEGGGYTALHFALYGDGDPVKKMRELLELGADMNTVDDLGRTPLHYAVKQNNLDVARLLLEQGAWMNVRDKYGATPLNDAARSNQEMADLLISYGASKAVLLPPPFSQEWDEYYSNVNARDRYGAISLHDAAGVGDVVKVHRLLKQGADPKAYDYHGTTPLHNGMVSGVRDVVMLLLSHGADVNARDMNGNASLHEAVIPGSLDAARMLLERGADVNIRNDSGDTPLHTAAFTGDRMFVRLLSDYGADMNAQNLEFVTPLERVLEDDNSDLVELLLELGADIDAPVVFSSWSMLHKAVSDGDLKLVHALLDHGADVDVRGHIGQTPLLFAVSRDSPEMVRLLLERGADVNARKNDSQTVLEFAMEKGNEEVIGLLQKNTGKPSVSVNTGE